MTLAQDFNQAWSWCAAIAGDPTVAVFDFRAIHDVQKDIPAIPFRGTLTECWPSICHYNNQGYGMFAVVAALDGVGRELANVHYMRANYVDLDEVDAQQQYDKACQAWPAPAMAVQSSPGKFHVYWPTHPYQGNERFTLVQRKLRQLFNGDKTIIDATRVMRLPGTFHQKNPAQPHMVTMWSLGGWGQWTTVDQLEAALGAVNVIDGGVGTRHDLGDPALAAPSLDWIKYALQLVDPNDLDRGEWIAMTAAIKQAGWTLTDQATLRAIWEEWCARYSANDHGENNKQWDSIRNTELGWPSMVRRVPSLQAAATFGGVDRSAAIPVASNDPATGPVASPAPGMPPVAATAPAMPPPPALDCSGEFLTHLEQQQWFKGCTFIVNTGEMMTPDGRFVGPTQFNGKYGGKHFIIDTVGKKTNEAWQAATRSTLWTVPKVDHTRFVPSEEYGAIIVDDLGRDGINVYRPANINHFPGDITPFLNHVAAMLPNPVDQRILLDFLAHNVKYPGHKIPWAPVIQSTEGAGKGVLKKMMRYAMGKSYVYYPKASELAKSGATFNKWLRHRLFILVDEVKVDEQRELIEILKPLISEEETEIQAKGVDQDLEDNFSNWVFFTNWKNAIPISTNSRRFAIMYSALQTVQDLIDRGMNQAYFDWLYQWLDNGGAAMVTHYLMNYPIERGAIPMRAPETSSTNAAVDQSRGPVERMILEAIEDGLPGFRGGWISATAVMARAKLLGTVRNSLQHQTVETVLGALGYVPCGRATRPYFQEDRDVRSQLFHKSVPADVTWYGHIQGYE